MKPSHWLMSYDLYERHQVVGRMIAAHRRADYRVLDVGGRVNLLSQFTACRVTSVNVDGSADVHYAGHRLPFADEAFDLVTAIDTLEHLPRSGRLSFVRECLRVSRQALILAAPFGSQGHQEAEARLNALFERLVGAPHRYLSEHVRYGLPDMREIQSLIEQSGARFSNLLFAGDYRRECAFFEAIVRNSTHRNAPKRIRPRLVAWIWHLRSRAILNPVKVTDHPLPHTNRFYLELLKPCATSSPAEPASLAAT
ncbi:MAG: methyltransferase domain-containing protein [Anaerolineae bacterium]|nr:class I SAM-dependent methyltransferase [Thermoflexales bacterium]MDW8407493.1 methyltransferase domain-containing protein [Anaerolineae bacterium]